MPTFTKLHPIRTKPYTGRIGSRNAIPDWYGIPENYKDRLGFVYLIVCRPTNRFYIGKKLFWSATKRVGKKIRQESNWREYFGSSKTVDAEIKQYGKQAFSRYIISCWDSKSELSLCELMYQLKHITNENCMNGIINVRLYIRPEMKLVRADVELESLLCPF